MKAFHFCSPSGIKILENLEVKITRPSEFNDPLEFYPYPDGPGPASEMDKKSCEAFHLTGAQFFHFICFCRNFENPRMWAQYASNHTGLMVEFDLGKKPFDQFTIENGGLIEVKYDNPKRVPLSECRVQSPERFKKIASRKGSHWKEEEEIRIVVPRHLITSKAVDVRETVVGERTLTLWRILEECILSVTLGLRASEDLKYSAQRLIEQHHRSVKLFHAKCHVTEFSMVREPVPRFM